MVDGDGKRYLEGQNGDHLADVPFQCDLCHLRNLEKRDPVVTNIFVMKTICRASLDAMWARESSTVVGNLWILQRMHQDARAGLGFENPLPALGPFPLKDVVGMRAAVMALQALRRRGRYMDHLQ